MNVWRTRALSLSWGLAVGVLVVAGEVWAVSGDADGTYTVTVTKIELSNDGGANFTTVFDGSQSINLRAVNAGAVAAGLVSGVTLEQGTYNTVRTTIGQNLLLKGYVNNAGAGTSIYTDGGTDVTAFTALAGLDNTTAADYSIATFTIPAASRTQSFGGFSIAVQPGVAHTVTVKFDTAGVITQAGGVPTVGAPSVTVTSQ
jgi:hypothetical protein